MIILGRKHENIGKFTNKTIRNSFGLISTGLVKKKNEDCVLIEEKKIGVADGHWGYEAAEIVMKNFADCTKPINKKGKALNFTKNSEDQIYARFGHKNMDEDKEFTPETSFLCTEIEKRKAHIFGYGDCYSFLIRDNRISEILPIRNTWLGAFSKLGLRNRLKIEKATLYTEFQLKKDDVIILCTDGVVECIYEKPTLSKEDILGIYTASKSPKDFGRIIFDRCCKLGAEDNIGIATYQMG